MRQALNIFGLMLLLWLGALPVAAFTRAESKAARMVASLQAGHDFPLAAPELLAAFIVMQRKTALREGGAENQTFTWSVMLVIHYKYKGYPARIARIVLGQIVFTDHLGTPFAWHNPVTDATSFTPFNPWGELLATHPDRGPPWETQGQVTTNGFTLPTDAVLPLPPMGLAGHLYDTDTGLVQMHHRSLVVRLGQFATPDYRAPNLYDPSTFTEPYAYAAGNPMLYLDIDGLDPTSKPFRDQLDGESREDYVIALIQFLSQSDFLLNEGDSYPGYRNFDPTSLLFSKITTENELEYQLLILQYLRDQDYSVEASVTYAHLFLELLMVKDEFLDKRKGWFFANHEIWWTNRFQLSSDGIHNSNTSNHPRKWKAEVNNYSGQVSMYKTYQVAEGVITAFGSGVNGGNRNAPGIFPVAKPLEKPKWILIPNSEGNLSKSQIDQVYNGVRDASQYLKSVGASRASRVQIIQSFQIESIKVSTAGESFYGLRFHDFGKNARPLGQYLFETFTPLTNRENLALPLQWNLATGIKQWQIRPSAVYIRGRVGAQTEYGSRFIGGGDQIFVYRPHVNGTLVEP